MFSIESLVTAFNAACENSIVIIMTSTASGQRPYWLRACHLHMLVVHQCWVCSCVQAVAGVNVTTDASWVRCVTTPCQNKPLL